MAPGATPAVAGTGSRSAQNAAAVASVAASQDG
jgi:hypothetical protein